MIEANAIDSPKGRAGYLAATISLVLWAATISPARAGHGESPSAVRDPSADVTDFYAFRSWEDPSKLVLILNVFGGQHPADGPIYAVFDDSVTYRVGIDNNRDGVANDVVYEFNFTTQHRPAFGQFTFSEPYVGHPNIPAPGLQGIRALEGPGSEGLTLRQTYTVTEIIGKQKRRLLTGRPLVAVPPNVGPTTMPDYETLAAQGIYADKEGVRVFAGQRAETYYGDTGALFDTATLRRFPPVLSPQEDARNDINPFGINRFAGSNVQSIAIEVPISRITQDRKPAEKTSSPMIGAYAATFRDRSHGGWSHMRESNGGGGWEESRVQVSRVGNAMLNTILIDTQFKDRYNFTPPSHDRQYQQMFADPSLTREPASLVFGIPVPPPPRTDLLSLFLKYPGQAVYGGECGRPCADLLRLNLQTPPTPPERQDRMGALLGTDPAGIPNGRRPNDDTIDFTVRIIGGPALIGAKVSDGVNYANGVPGAGTMDGPGYGKKPGNKLDVLANGIVAEFPFLPTPHSGLVEPIAP